eukprot:364779-Chlamydomonas_euryale.AAC.17
MECGGIAVPRLVWSGGRLLEHAAREAHGLPASRKIKHRNSLFMNKQVHTGGSVAAAAAVFRRRRAAGLVAWSQAQRAGFAPPRYCRMDTSSLGSAPSDVLKLVFALVCADEDAEDAAGGAELSQQLFELQGIPRPLRAVGDNPTRGGLAFGRSPLPLRGGGDGDQSRHHGRSSCHGALPCSLLLNHVARLEPRLPELGSRKGRLSTPACGALSLAAPPQPGEHGCADVAALPLRCVAPRGVLQSANARAPVHACWIVRRLFRDEAAHTPRPELHQCRGRVAFASLPRPALARPVGHTRAGRLIPGCVHRPG